MARSDTTYSTSDLSRRSDDIIAEALRRPVTITQFGKPRLVILNIEDYERMRRQANSRTVGTLETMPDRLLNEVESAIECLNETLFSSLAEARTQITLWKEDYNRQRPHSSLGNITPEEFAMKMALEKQAA